MEWIVVWSVAVGLSLLVIGWFARLVSLDGYGTQAAPRGAEDWTAHGLPSRPYGL